MDLNVQSTRLFPRSLGADRYQLSGIAARCDWVVLSDRKPPQVYLKRLCDTRQPRHVFLSLRGPFAALRYFATRVLPMIQAPFVLISGSEDVTLPRQLDRRWRRFNSEEQGYIRAILDSPYLLRWFAENLDDDSDPRLQPMPLGMVFEDSGMGPVVQVPEVSRLASRPPRALCFHRVREGPQWQLRRQVTELARTNWSPWCTVAQNELTHQAFNRLLQQHAFVLCVDGGGIDPSPKAWIAILHGAVPIIRRSALASAYAELPVVFVDDWNADALSRQRLVEWQAALAPHYDAPEARARVLEKLGLDYWWSKITGQFSLARRSA